MPSQGPKQSRMCLAYINLVLFDFSDVEAFSLLVSCLCHDIDHRGTTNAFQTATVIYLMLVRCSLKGHYTFYQNFIDDRIDVDK